MPNDDMSDFIISLDIPKKYTVKSAHNDFFILADEKGNGIKVDKTKENRSWKVGMIVELPEK